MSLRFRWNNAKARKNFRKHGVSFEFAKAVFNDVFALELLDDRSDYGEERFVIIGMVDAQVLYMAYSEHDDAIRMISARRATKHEEQAYYEQGWGGTQKDDATRH